MENSMRNNTKTSKPDITRRHYSGAGEESRSQQRPHADLGSSSNTERKTTNTVGKDRLYSPSQPDKQISRGPSSSHHRSLHTSQPSWRQAKREASVTSNLDNRFSRLSMAGNRRRLKGGGEDTYKVEGTYKFLGIPVGSFEGKATKEESTEHQPAAETAAAETGSGDTAAADTAAADTAAS